MAIIEQSAWRNGPVGRAWRAGAAVAAFGQSTRPQPQYHQYHQRWTVEPIAANATRLRRPSEHCYPVVMPVCGVVPVIAYSGAVRLREITEPDSVDPRI
jgi:hypothetical protein